MQSVEILKRARALITRPECWLVGDLARLAPGDPDQDDDDRVRADHPRAARFCSVGALQRAAFELEGVVTAWGGAADALARALPFSPPRAPHTISEFNDSHTHADILAAFDRAIALAEGGAA